MNKREFDAFVQESNDEKTQLKENVHERLNSWRKKVEELFELVRELLSDYIENKTIIVSEKEIQAIEENFGSYQIPSLEIEIGIRKVVFVPKGAFVIGAYGRVDIIKGFRKVVLVLVDKAAKGVKFSVNTIQDKPGEPNLVWKIATSPPSIKYVELNKESLYDALIEVANG
jgi:hypothetical protein